MSTEYSYNLILLHLLYFLLIMVESYLAGRISKYHCKYIL